MSGKRAKALRRELKAKLGRAPQKADLENTVRMEYGEHKRTAIGRIKTKIGWWAKSSQKFASQVVNQSEFRHYKRHRTTEAEEWENHRLWLARRAERECQRQEGFASVQARAVRASA